MLLEHILCSAGESHTESASKTREAISDISSDEEIFVFPLSWIEFRSSNTLAAEKMGGMRDVSVSTYSVCCLYQKIWWGPVPQLDQKQFTTNKVHIDRKPAKASSFGWARRMQQIGYSNYFQLF